MLLDKQIDALLGSVTVVAFALLLGGVVLLFIDKYFSYLEKNKAKFAVDLIFEPSPEKIIEQLLVKHFDLQIYRAMSESVASEHGARMTAMENSSNNARDMIAKLTLGYNKIRQEKITTELTEITSGAEALK